MEPHQSPEEIQFEGANKQTVNIFACTSCGANLNYKPGTQTLHCEYCGSENEIPQMETVTVDEINLDEFISRATVSGPRMSITAVNCTNCGATTSVDPKLKSATCPYCVTPLVIESNHAEEVILPGGILPFKLNKDEAKHKFKAWLKGLWFAPNDLKKASHDMERFKSVYIPYWTFDSQTTTPYIGQRGTYYYTTQTYTAVENGKSVTKTRQVRNTRWHTVSGTVSHFFDDILILASHSLPVKYAERLEPWDLKNIEPFQEAYLGGFITEKYQVDLQPAFVTAKGKMEDTIRGMVRQHIGGDEQRIVSMLPRYSDTTFKHILLPIYISAFRYKKKTYRFLVNARTGEVQGERPYSAWKIALLIISILFVIGIIIALVQMNS